MVLFAGFFPPYIFFLYWFLYQGKTLIYQILSMIHIDLIYFTVMQQCFDCVLPLVLSKRASSISFREGDVPLEIRDYGHSSVMQSISHVLAGKAEIKKKITASADLLEHGFYTHLQ